MARLIIESADTWTREKIKFAIDTEIHFLKGPRIKYRKN